MTVLLVLGYLAAIVVANLTTAHWGPEWSILNALLLVGLVLTTRDRLHDAWKNHRVRNMALLIGAGSAISYVAAVWLAPGVIPSDVVAKIALASCVAFAVSEAFDWGTYHVLRRKPWLERVTSSNVVGATLDSVIFVSIAFGFDIYIIVAQIGAKVAGGYLWALTMRRRRRDVVAA
jgi:uncharacterized PurR-regulated membrane protein YhhQ (DUF165 family)